MNKILEVNRLSVCFKQKNSDNFCAVDDVSFSLGQGEILGIVGESGSGKSVMAHSILGLLPYPKAFHTPESSILFHGKECLKASDKFLRKIRGGKIGFIFQEPMSSLNPLHKIGDQIAENLILHQKMTHKKAWKKTIELLQKVEIDNPLERYNAYPFELSGGQRQRVMIAMALANSPEILIADEPTTALDVTVQEQIINLLLKLKKEFNISIIFISHDLILVHQIADRIIVVHKGKIVESGTAEEIFEHPVHEYTSRLVNAGLSQLKNKKCQKKPILTADQVSVTFPLQKSFLGKVKKALQAVDHVTLNLYKGQTLGLVGESGSGKTTLGQCLAGLCKYQGRITLAEGNVTEKKFHQKVQIVFQDPYNSLNPRLNIMQIVSEGLKVHFPELKIDQQRQKVIEILHEVGLKDADLEKYPHEFSGGQRQRIAIARALIIKPEVVILDEPTSALDVTIQVQMIELLKKLQEKFKIAYLFISHDMRAVKSMADQIAVMKNGKIVEYGSNEQIFTNPKTEYAQKLIKASLIS